MLKPLHDRVLIKRTCPVNRPFGSVSLSVCFGTVVNQGESLKVNMGDIVLYLEHTENIDIELDGDFFVLVGEISILGVYTDDSKLVQVSYPETSGLVKHNPYSWVVKNFNA